MGNCPSSTNDEASARSRDIDNMIKMEAKENGTSVKLLLLGPGDSGKSTLLKQFRLIYGQEFSEHERHTYRTIIIGNLLSCAKTLIEQMAALEIPYGYKPSKDHSAESGPIEPLPPDGAAGSEAGPPSESEVQEAVAVIKAAPKIFGENDPVTPDLKNALSVLWRDPGVQCAYSRRNEYQIISACAYLFKNINRICAPNYYPSNQDILCSRIITTSITETKIKVESAIFRIFDLGGQRSERKKWAPYFDDVKCIIFVADLSGYDSCLLEEQNVNRMTEALNLFKAICNHVLFKETAIILFLNKIDLFQEKIHTIPVSNYFPEFKGPNAFDKASEFFAEKFSSLNQNENKIIYVHFTWATDTTQIKKVLLTTNQIILQSNLQAAGII